MSFTFNTIPALSTEFLETMENAKSGIRTLKEKAYGEDSNKYKYEHSPRFYPELMTCRELEREIHKIFPDSVLEKLAAEERELRPQIDYNLVKTVVTQVLPQLAGPKTLFEYNLYVAARDMRQIDSTTDPRRGRKDRQSQIIALPLEEWPSAWEEHIFLDKMADSDDIKKYLPENTTCLLSTVHRFYAVKKMDNRRQRKNKNHDNRFLPGFGIEDDKLQVDCRTKSGAEFSWKIIPYLTGLEDKPGEKRESIVDLAGARIILSNGFEEHSIELYRYFMRRYRGDCEGLLILQILNPDQNKVAKELLDKVPAGLKRFISKTALGEDRSATLSPEDVEKLQKKYYIEMLTPFCVTSCGDGVFGRNVIDILSYPLETFKKIHEKQDDFIYKGRAEDWRSEHYTYLEWYLLNMLAPVLLTGHSLRYIESVVDSKLPRRYR